MMTFLFWLVISWFGSGLIVGIIVAELERKDLSVFTVADYLRTLSVLSFLGYISLYLLITEEFKFSLLDFIAYPFKKVLDINLSKKK